MTGYNTRWLSPDSLLRNMTLLGLGWKLWRGREKVYVSKLQRSMLMGRWKILSPSLIFELASLGMTLLFPANLAIRDVFFDANVGNITISSVEERTCADATRTVVHATTPETAYHWDKAQASLLRGNQHILITQ